MKKKHNPKTIEERIIDLFLESIGYRLRRCTKRSEITSATRLSDYGFDSLDMAEFTIQLEKEFKIDIPPDELNYETLEDVNNMVKRHLPK